MRSEVTPRSACLFWQTSSAQAGGTLPEPLALQVSRTIPLLCDMCSMVPTLMQCTYLGACMLVNVKLVRSCHSPSNPLDHRAFSSSGSRLDMRAMPCNLP